MNWISRNAEALEAVGSIVGAVATIIGVAAIGYQLNYSDRQQTLQAARESYQNHLNQSLAFPQLAAPMDECVLLYPQLDPSYGTFMEQLIHTAEEMLAVQPGWEGTFEERLMPHSRYVCLIGSELADTNQARALLNDFIQAHCPITPGCDAPEEER